LLVSGARTAPNATWHVGTSVRPRRIGWVILAIALPVLAWCRGAVPPAADAGVRERLTDMVAVQVGGEERRILPGGSFSLKLDRARRLDLS